MAKVSRKSTVAKPRRNSKATSNSRISVDGKLKVERLPDVELTVQPVSTGEVRMRLLGETSLLMHSWSKKSQLQMLGAQTGEGRRKPREPRCPEEEYIEAMYWLDGEKPTVHYDEQTKKKWLKSKEIEKAVASATFGVPCRAIKKAAKYACRFVNGVPMTLADQAIWVTGVSSEKNPSWDLTEFTQLHADPPTMHDAPVRIGKGNNKSCEIRFRGVFRTPWYIDVVVGYSASNFSAEDVYNLFTHAGTFCGLLEDRPERGGNFGKFQVEPLPTVIRKG